MKILYEIKAIEIQRPVITRVVCIMPQYENSLQLGSDRFRDYEVWGRNYPRGPGWKIF